MLVDSHAHLDMPEFASDRADVILRAVSEGVGCIITVGCDLASSRAALQLAESFPQVYAAMGFHPHDAHKLRPSDLAELKALCQHPKVVAVGEMGLDFYRQLSPREEQQRAFEAQLSLAAECNLPVVVHCRGALAETHAVVSRWVQTLDVKGNQPLGVMHCFGGSREEAQHYLKMGFLISIAGPITFPNARRLRELAIHLPLESLLLETDCPFLSPNPWRGQRNEPAYLKQTAEVVAQLRGVSLQVVAQQTSENAQRLFPRARQGLEVMERNPL